MQHGENTKSLWKNYVTKTVLEQNLALHHEGTLARIANTSVAGYECLKRPGLRTTYDRNNMICKGATKVAGVLRGATLPRPLRSTA